MTVADALQRSREAHLHYRESLPRRVRNGSSTVVVAGDAEQAGLALSDACRWRAEAHVLDPQQTDLAWGDEVVSYDHPALLDFYVAQLIREPRAIQVAINLPTLLAIVDTHTGVKA